jgi:hypothetical protein
VIAASSPGPDPLKPEIAGDIPPLPNGAITVLATLLLDAVEAEEAAAGSIEP